MEQFHKSVEKILRSLKAKRHFWVLDKIVTIYFKLKKLQLDLVSQLYH
jgi:hypothetical protein